MTQPSTCSQRREESIRRNIRLPFSAEGVEWPYGAVTTISSNRQPKVKGFAHLLPEDGSMLSMRGLPVEFFHQQLLAINPDNERDLERFVSSWGFPFSPLRVDETLLSDYEATPDGFGVIEIKSDLAEKTMDAIKESDLLLQESRFLYFGLYKPISVNEARLTIELLQDIVKDINSSVVGNREIRGDYARVLNASTTNDNVIRRNSEMASFNFKTLTNAICNQIVATVADSSPWYLCECCGMAFKKKQGKSKRPSTKSVYCSDSCKERHVKAKQRAAAANRRQR